MINYSVNARQNPQSEEEDVKYYANAQYIRNLDMAAFAKHIQSHGCVYSRADIQAILILADDCIREQLLEGNKVSLGELGAFSISLKSKGTRHSEDFLPVNIKEVNATWTPGPLFKDLRQDAKFNKVSSRAAQAATLAAETKGEGTVDLAKAKQKN